MILSPRVRFKSVMDVLVLFTSASDTFQFASAVVGVAAILVAGFLLWIAFKNVVLAPWLISNALQKQGVQGVPYTISLGKLRFAGNSPPSTSSAAANLRPHRTVAPLIAPLYYDWKLKYGDVFLFWVGYRPVLSVSNLEHMKEILYNKSGHFEKPSLRPDVKDVEGEAVSSLRGERWSIHRRIVSPAFFYDKLKAMTPAIVDCAKVILDDWESQIQYKSNKEVNVYDELKALSADIIARCAFGSSYEEGRRFFKLQQEQEKVILQVYQSVYIPGVRYLPTKQNRHAWKLKRTIEEIVSEIIEKRGNGYDGTDLLEILMDANRQEFSQSREKLLSFREIVDECKLFFYAGHETTSTLIAWTFLLLAQNPHWQEEARKEVLHVCGKGLPTHENLHGLKVVGMILNEALRMYPPAPYLIRETVKETKLGGLSIPRDTMFLLPIIDFQFDRALWGDDVHDFNPQRFADGIGNACKASAAYAPFSMGPRNCLGQSFAMLESRAIVAMTLQRFTFTVSPGYIHCPIATFTLRPQYGIQIIFKKLE